MPKNKYSYKSYKDLSYEISESEAQIKLTTQNNLTELRYFDLWVLEDFDWYGDLGLVRRYKKGVYPSDTIIVKMLKVDGDSTGLAGKEDEKEIGRFTFVKMK